MTPVTPFRIVFFFFLLAFSSLLCLPLLTIDYLPPATSNELFVVFNYHNKTPLTVEKEVTAPLENELSKLSNLEKIYSVSNYGSGYIQLSFKPNTIDQYTELEVLAILRQIRSDLPAQLSGLSLTDTRQDEKKPLQIYEFLYDEVHLEESNKWLTQYFIPSFSKFQSIENSELSGMQNFAWRIEFDLLKLKSLGINPSSLVKSLQTHFRSENIGIIEKDNYQNPLFYQSVFTDKRDIQTLEISYGIKLSDVATISYSPEKPRFIKRINGKNAVLISVFAQEEVNKIELAKQVSKYIKNDIQKPDYLNIQLNYDDTEFLVRELDKTNTRALLSIFVLFVMLILTSRKVRVIINLLLSILVSLGISITVSYLLRIPIHLYTIAAITVSLGVIIDNCIIMLDHFSKYKNTRIIFAQTASSFTTIIALLVVFFLPRDFTNGLEDFAAMLAISLSVSLVVSLFFTPAMYQILPFATSSANNNHFIRNKGFSIYFKLLNFLTKYRRFTFASAILIFGLPVFLIPPKIEGFNLYNSSIGSDYFQENIKPYVFRYLGGTSRLFYQYVYESPQYRTPEKTKLYVNARLPYGHTLEQMDAIINNTEAYLSQFSEIDKFMTSVNSGRNANITIEFKPEYENGSFPYLLKNRLIERSIDWGGVDWSVYGVGRGFSNASNIDIPGFRVAMKGYNFNELGNQAERFAEKLLRHKRIQEVNTDSQLGWYQESFEKFTLLPKNQIPHIDFQTQISTLQWSSQRSYPALYLPYQDQSTPIYIESKESSDFSIYDATQRSLNGKASFSQLTDVTFKKSLDAIHKEDRQYIKNIAFDYFGSYRFGDEYLTKMIEEMKTELPTGYSIDKTAWSWGSKEKQQQNLLLLLVIFAIFFISSIYLESLSLALKVILIIPFSFVGIFIAFGWIGFTFDQGGYASFLLTCGLSVNATLYLLSDYLHLRKTNDNNQALQQAIISKSWPIALTILSTCLGLIPFIIHGESEVFWFSFAIGSIFSLIASLFTFFILIPVLLMKKTSS